MSENAKVAAEPQSSQRKHSLLIFLVILIIAAAAAATWYFKYAVWSESTDDAYVNGNLVELTPETTGTVTSITADDGDYVKKGQVLVQFDRSDAQLNLEAAESSLAQTVRQVRILFNNVEQAKAVVDQRKIALTRAQSDVQRRQNMVKVGGLSEEELTHAKDVVNTAEQALIAAQQQLKAQQAMVTNTTVTSHPLVKSAIAKLRQAYLDRQRTVLISPVSGYIAKRNVQVGQRVNPGATLMAIVPLEQTWIDANFKETQLNKMRIGQPVTVTSDLYGDNVVYHGTVENLGIGTGSAFSLLPAQNATGNWIKVVQRLPVRIQIDPQDLQKHPLRIGLSMIVDVDLHQQNGELLAQAPVLKPRFETNVYAQQLDGVDPLVTKIIAENDPSSANSMTTAHKG
jgi:membrane fusion protein (multidrug efflux system)